MADRLAVSVGNLVDRLCIVNLRIWHLEEGLRRGDNVSDADAGRLAKDIRDANRERVALKNGLDAALEASPFPDVKVNHRSAST